MFFAETLGPTPAGLAAQGLHRFLKQRLNGRGSMSAQELQTIAGEFLRTAGVKAAPETIVEILVQNGLVKFQPDQSAQIAA